MSCPFSGGGERSSDEKAGGMSCPWSTESVHFKRWVTEAITDEYGVECSELYTFLVECFKDADSDRDGLVNEEEFDFLCERAGALPRRFGLAPGWKEMYGDVAARRDGRAELFRDITEQTGKDSIGIDDWVQYAFAHIEEKLETMSMKGLDFNNLRKTGKSNFLRFLKTAVADKTSQQYQELYQFLFKSFVRADTDQKGRVTFHQFDKLVELAANAPRSLGLAPTTQEMFSSNEEKLAKRKELFDTIDKDGMGTVSFGEFLSYTIQHIDEKVSAVNGAVRQYARVAAWGGVKSRLSDADLAAETVVQAREWTTTASAFAPWVRKAVADKEGLERRELYAFLCDAFMDADADRDGYVGPEEFDFLCEKAAALPRRFGLAPSWRDLYGTAEKRFEARSELFKKVDSTGRGKIGIDDWVNYAFAHIEEKVKTMHQEVVDFGDLPKTGKDKFLSFLKTATSDKKSREYIELYGFLFNCFVEADAEAKGAVTAEQFDHLVEISAEVPRVLGLAPKSAEMFKTDDERTESRRKLFESMSESDSEMITFDEYLSYTLKHIAGKVGSEGAGKCPMGFH